MNRTFKIMSFLSKARKDLHPAKWALCGFGGRIEARHFLGVEKAERQEDHCSIEKHKTTL